MSKPMSDLDCFAFDVLGDFVPVDTIHVDEERGCVVVRKCPRHLMGMMHEDWRRATFGSKYERIRLVLSPAA